MKVKLFLVLTCLFFSAENFGATKYWVTFTDKTGTPYSTSNPSAFLSTRSIQRRTNQNIPVTTYDLPVNPSYVSQVLATGAVTLNYRSRWLNAISITTTDANALTAIAALPFVQSVGAVIRMKRDGDNAGYNENNLGGKYFNELPPQPTVYNYGQSYNQVNQINAVCLHNQGYHGEGMQIAVLDDGFRNVNSTPAFDSIRINNQILGTYDFVALSPNVYSVGGHGTMVLSDMAGYVDGQLIGTAPKAGYWLLRTEDATSEYLIEEDNWVAGAEFADSVGADIICTSLYYTQFDDANQNHTYSDMDGRTTVCAIAAVFTARVGMLTFACAGNSGTSPWYYIGTPADADSILTVGAVDGSGNLAGFSSRGPSFDGRTKPDICALGVGAYVANYSGNIVTANGTSFATPLSAGAAACLWQSIPGYTAMQIRYAIQRSSSQWSNPDNNKGYGIPDFCNAGILLSATEPGNELQILSFYPNPTAGLLNLKLLPGRQENVQLIITDIRGSVLYFKNIVLTRMSNHLIIPEFSAFEDGLYFLSVKEGNTSETVKVIKLR